MGRCRVAKKRHSRPSRERSAILRNGFSAIGRFFWELTYVSKVTAIFWVLATGIVGCAESQGRGSASAQISTDPHTPDGALNLYCRSIEKGDTETAASLIDYTNVDASYRQLRIDALITDAQFLRTAEPHYGLDAAVRICEAYRLPIGVPLRKFVPGEFDYSNDGSYASGRSNLSYSRAAAPDPATAAPLMCRDQDGIWRIWFPGVHGGTGENGSPSASWVISICRQDIQMKTKLIAAINTGRYPNPDDLVAAIAPVYEQPHLWRFNPAPESGNTTNTDKSTIQGAIETYHRAFTSRDRPGIADFFYADGDPNGDLANARAARVISTLRLKDAVDWTFHVGNQNDGVILAKGLSGIGDQP